jgi:hypothetical protein
MRAGDTITYFIYSDSPLQGGSILDDDDNQVELCGTEGIFGGPSCAPWNLLLLD